MIQVKHEEANFSYRKSSNCTIHVCESADFENLFNVVFCQIGDIQIGDKYIHCSVDKCIRYRAKILIVFTKLAMRIKEEHSKTHYVMTIVTIVIQPVAKTTPK